MKLTSFFLCLLLVSLPARQTLADDLSSAPASYSSGYGSALPAPEIKVSAGRPGAVKLSFSVKSGYHINSNHPNSDLLIPTKFRLVPPPAIGIAEVTYPVRTDL